MVRFKKTVLGVTFAVWRFNTSTTWSWSYGKTSVVNLGRYMIMVKF